VIADLRHVLRTLAATPGFTAAAIVTLALGIGANTAIFTALYGVLLRPLPYPEPDQLVRITEGRPGVGLNVSYPNFADWRARSRAFAGMAVYLAIGGDVIRGDGGDAEVYHSGNADPALFDVLGRRAARGRLLNAADQEPDAPATAVISDRLWRTRYGNDPSVVGRTVRVGEYPVTIVGVLPPQPPFQDVDIWLPLRPKLLSPMQMDRANHPGFQVIARLRRGVDLETARRDMSGIAASLERQYPVSNRQMSVFLTPLLDAMTGGARATLRALYGAVSVLLLIACANVANLLLARGVRRERETSIRSALGAGRRRLARLFMFEGLALGLGGGAAGLLLAAWGIRILREVPGFALPRAAEIAIDPHVLGFAVALAVATAVLFSLAPALQFSRVDLMQVLRLTGASAESSSSAASRMRSVLVAAEVALAIVLLAGAALMERTLSFLTAVDSGFQPGQLLAVQTIPPARYDSPDAIANLARTLVDRLPGGPIAKAAASWPFDYTGPAWAPNINIPERPFEAGREPSAMAAAVTPGYFETMGIPFVRGRNFDASERPGRQVAVVVSRTFASRFFPDEDPLGKRVSALRIPAMQDMPIIGVVGDTRRGGMLSGYTPEIYVAYEQFPQSGATIVVRAATVDPLAVSGEVKARIAAVDAQIALTPFRRLSDVLAATYGDRRALAWLLAVFGALALVLTTIGIGSVVAFTVAQRTAEIGIRIALGAGHLGVRRLIVRSALGPVAAGAAAGLAALVPLSRLLRQYLFGVSPLDPLSIAGACLLIGFSALAAAYMPARQASVIDPLVALRNTR
jgi:putative ABC transport system permease protein